tara:strand:+ start:326 stop:1120 length:795 start_codon:yes stop_codon:yes gene_type:complete
MSTIKGPQIISGGKLQILGGKLSIVTPGGTATEYLDENFNSLSEGYGQRPTNWTNTTGGTVYGSTTATRKWDVQSAKTPSYSTGPTADHLYEATDGREGTGKYVYTEASGQYNKRCLLRTSALDFSSALSNSTLKLIFWFHMYGANIGKLGVAATTHASSASSANEAASGTGFTSDTADGMTIVYWNTADDDGSSTASGVRITGQQQTAGNGSTTTAAHWRKATVDLNALAGNGNTIYIYFFGLTGASYWSDLSIDDINISGEE